MSRFERRVWEQSDPPTTREPISNYELLCRAAAVRDLHVELLYEAGEATELRISEHYTAVLYGIDDLERAARELCVRLAREVSR